MTLESTTAQKLDSIEYEVNSSTHTPYCGHWSGLWRSHTKNERYTLFHTECESSVAPTSIKKIWIRCVAFSPSVLIGGRGTEAVQTNQKFVHVSGYNRCVLHSSIGTNKLSYSPGLSDSPKLWSLNSMSSCIICRFKNYWFTWKCYKVVSVRNLYWRLLQKSANIILNSKNFRSRFCI